MSQTVRRRSEGGFTLVEILVVITIIAALISLVAAIIPQATAGKRKTQCANNLRQIGGMLVQRSAGKGLGSRGGAAMLLQTYKLGLIRKGDESVFICPGDPRQQNLADPDILKRFASVDLDNIDPEICSYAGRNRKAFPLKLDSREKEPWAVDCNGPDGRTSHHADGVNCLYDDGSVRFLDREDLGILNQEEEIVVGEESSNETLKKFTVLGN